MRVIVVGLGVQGKKRLAVAGNEAVATVDPVNPDAKYKSVEDVPLGSYDAALLCIPDEPKIKVISYLLSNRKHVLVEKPLFADEPSRLLKLKQLAEANRTVCYTAYNHRFEPRFVRMWEFYLAASEMSFREQNMMVMQIQLTKRQGVVPITRNYIASEERRLAAAENKRRPPLRLAGE